MKITKKQVLVGTLIAFVAILIVDIWLLVTKSPTISSTILYYTFDKRIVFAPLLMGVLTGHFFLPNNLNIIKKWWVLVIIGIILIALTQVLALITDVHMLIFFMTGFFSGAILWNQKPIKKA